MAWNMAKIVATSVKCKSHQNQTDRSPLTEREAELQQDEIRLGLRLPDGTIPPYPELPTFRRRKPIDLEKRALDAQARQAELRKKCPPVNVKIPVEVRCEIPCAEWQVKVDGTGTHLWQKVKWDAIDFLPRPFNPWSMRMAFFRIKRGDLKGLVSFLKKYGKWSDTPPEDPQQYWRVQDDLKNILLEKPFYRELLRDKVERLFNEPYAAFFPWVVHEGVWVSRPKPAKSLVPRVALNASSCLDALRLSIEIDMARGVKFGQCARKDCRAPYPVTTRHKRLYCTPDCAHLVSEKRSAKKRGRNE
jgi:hypothetical protein